MSRQQGLTLIELMTTLAVAGLLTSIALPAMSSFSANTAQTAAINDFVSSLHLARTTAISTNRRVNICASASGTGCETVNWNAGWIVFVDLDSDGTLDTDEIVLTSRSGSDDISLASSQFSASMIYRPNGRVVTSSFTGNAGTITFCDDRGADKAKVVIIDLSGRPGTSTTMPNGDLPSCPG